MNTKRLLLGGLLAGLVLNIGEAALHAGVLADATVAAYKALGREPVASASGMAQLVGMTFIQGLLGMRLYASMIQKSKPGAGTAVRVGLVLWFLSVVYGAVYLGAGFPGLMPSNVVWLPVLWGLFEFPIAMVAGASVYRER